MIRQRPELKKTPTYRMEFFDDGDLYYSDADYKRFQTIENQLESLLKITGGGILNGWEVFQNTTNGNLGLTISPGIGIIPFVQDKIDVLTGNKIFDEKTGEVVKETYYLAIRTKTEINISSAVGVNRKSVVFVGLSPESIRKIQAQDLQGIVTEDKLIEWDDFTEITISPSVGNSELSGKTGPYRNTTPSPNDIDYPIKNFIIDGEYNPNTQKIVAFVNGKPYYDGFEVNGKTLIFENPLHREDSITVRIEPKYGLALSDIETDDTSIIKIDSSIRVSVFTKSADSFIYKNLLEHKHTNDFSTKSPEKILLTTQTGLIGYATNTDNKTYIFDKKINGKSFSEYYGFSFDSGTYDLDIFINGFLNTDPVTITDSGSTITLEFSQKLDSTDTVQLVFYVKNNYTQIKNKLIISQTNPSQEKIDIEISGESIKSGKINEDLIPRLSHVGIFNEIMKPDNPSSGEEFVHQTENIDKNFLKEFFPVYNKKMTGRNCFDIFGQPKILPGVGITPSKQIVHLCTKDGLLYYVVPFDESQKSSETRKGFLMGSTLGQYFEGWKNINFDTSDNLKEFDSPFCVLPVKTANSPTTNNWDLIFLISEKFVVAISWSNINLSSTADPVPKILQVLNTTGDSPSDIRTNNIYYSKVDSIGGIVSAVSGKGILNLEKTVYILTDSGKVYCFDYVDNQYTWVDVTGEPTWTTATKIFSLNYEDELSNDIIFVGEEGSLYFNSIGKYRFESTIPSNTTQLTSITFEPNTIWDGLTNKLVDSGDILIFFGNKLVEKKQISLIQYNLTSPYSAQIALQGTLSKTFPKKEGSFYRSGMIKEWTKHSFVFSGTPIEVMFYDSRLFILTTENLYVSNQTFTSISSVNYEIDSCTFSEAFSSSKDLNDIRVINDEFVLSADDGIFSLSFDYSLIPVEYNRSENLDYVTSINDLLYPSYRIYKEDSLSTTDDVVFSLGKYGVFQSTDKGSSWRNITQLLGQPEDKNFFNSAKQYLKIVGVDSVQNKIYVIKENGSYGYGYGYGYGLDLNYFDVFDFDSFEMGYGVGSFESLSEYGYAFGFEISNAVEGLEEGDWIYFPDGAGGAYEKNPLKIIGFGIEGDRNYIVVEGGNGYSADFSQIPQDLVVEVYSKLEPLGLINGIPQSELYETNNVETYSFDPFRQSIQFSSTQSIEDSITIASKYKTFSLIEDFDISSKDIEKISLNLNGIDLLEYWTKDNAKFNFNKSLNIEDIVRITVKDSHITDTGKYTHKEIEDSFSLETMGLTYEMDGIRTSNLLTLLMQLKHKFKDIQEFSTSTEVSFDITSFGASSGQNDPWIQNVNTVYAPGAFVGRSITFSKNNKNYKYTISANTLHRFYIQRVYCYEYFVANGSESTFTLLKGEGKQGTFTVFKNGNKLTSSDFTENLLSDNVISIELVSATLNGDNIFIKYINTDDDFEISTLFENLQSVTIPAMDNSITSKLTNIFVSNYRDNDFIIDLDRSFIENEIYSENSTDIGDVDYVLFYVFNDSVNNKFYAGTDENIWIRDVNSIIYSKTGVILETLNPIGNSSFDEKIDGAYIQYNNETNEWTVIWGGQPVISDINLDISTVKVNNVIVVDDKICFAGTDRGFYRTLSGSNTWEYVWNTIFDKNTKDSPEILNLVLDDKHPWILNAILESGLYRSYDYGNNWIWLAGNSEKTFTTFSYQKDLSDSRSVYYYGNDSLFVKKYSSETENISSKTNEISTDLLFGSNFISSSILKIVNNKSDVDKVYFGMNFLGVYSSELLGGSGNIARTNFSANNYGTASNSISFDSIGIEKTGALHDSYSPAINYSLYVSSEKTDTKRMFYQVDVDPVVAKVLEDHKFVDYFAKMPDGKFYKILDNYDRGPVYEFNYLLNDKNETLDVRRMEFVLEGTYPYFANRSGANIDSESGDYWYSTNEPFGEALNTISISFTKESNGEDSRVMLGSFDDKNAYAVKSTIWTDSNTSEDETVLIVDYETVSEIPLEYQTEDALSGYYVGNPKNKLFYKVYNSKVLGVLDQYYDGEASPARGQLALRIEKKEDSDEANWNTIYKTEDPYYLWHKYFGLEIHNNWRAILRDPSSVNSSPDFYNDFEYDFTTSNTQKIFSSNLEGRTYVVYDDLFEDGKNQASILLSYEDELSTDYSVDNSLLGFIIKDPSCNYEYEVTASKKLVSGDTYYSANYHRVQCRIERYDGSYDKISLYSDGSYSDIQTDRIKLTNRVGLNEENLIGSFVYFEKRPFITFRVKEIDGDYIVVDSTNLNSFVQEGEILKCKYQIEERTCKDLVITSSGKLFTVSDNFVYTDRSTDTQKWYCISDGLELNPDTNLPYAKFSSLCFDNTGNYLYAASPTNIYGGVYVHDSSTTNTDFTKILSDSDLINNEKITSIDLYRDISNLILYLGTSDNGVFKGVSDALNPLTSIWTWTKIVFPENDISSIETVVDQDANIDLDRIWIGTDGSGIFKRDQISNSYLENSWIGNIPSEVSSKDINSSEWKVWRVNDGIDNLYPIVLDDDGSVVYEKIESPGTITNGIFDWDQQERYDKKLGNLYYVLDSGNINYITDSFGEGSGWNGNTIISESSRNKHKFSNVATSSVTNNERKKEEDLKGSGSVSPNSKTFFKFDFMFNGQNGESPYEEPFKHHPDKNSIVKIIPLSGGDTRLLVITDRDGVFLSGNAERYLLPEPLSGYLDDYTTYGYAFSETQFDEAQDELIEYPGYRYTNQGYSKDFSENTKFNKLLEKLFMFEIDSTHPAYSDIGSFISAYGSESLLNSYLIISKGVDEVGGIKDPITFIVKSVELSGLKYKIKLSIGRQNSQSEGNFSILENPTYPVDNYIGFSWENGFSWDGYDRFVFMDAQEYVKINNGLPSDFNALDIGGEKTLEILIRDAVEDGSNGVYLACGINGVYYCPDVTVVSPTWSQLSGSSDKYAISIAYGTADDGTLYVGTIKEGVWRYVLLTTTWYQYTGLEKHPQVWCLYADGKTVYAGTEHGGVYSSGDSVIFVRMSGCVRSKIFSWKTVGVPPRKEDVLNNSVFDYSENYNLLSYSYGGGIMVSRDRGLTWEQANNGLKNLYVQEVSICPNNSNIVYAATCGGGVFKSINAFDESGGVTSIVWESCSTEFLPITLNVDEVSVGTNPNIIYIKCRVNDFSIKDSPNRIKKYLFGKPLINSDDLSSGELLWVYDSPENLITDGKSYYPYCPYDFGTRKHVIYKSLDGGDSWQSVYDIELVSSGISENIFKSENMISGLTVVHGGSDEIKFISSYKIEYKLGSNNYFFEKMSYTTMTFDADNNFVFSEKEIPASDFRLFGELLMTPSLLKSEGHLSINPKDKNEVFLTIQYNDAFSRFVKVPILYSNDDGNIWERRVSVFNSETTPGFNSPVQFSTRQTSQDIDFNVSYLSEYSESLTLEGIYTKRGFNEESFLWDSVRDLARVDNKFINIDFQTNDQWNNSSYKLNLFLDANKIPRPFTLKDATLIADNVNEPNNIYTVENSGYGEYYHRNTNSSLNSQTTTLKLNSAFNGDSLIVGETSTCLLSNLTSFKIPYSEASLNTILSKENLLVGREISFGENTYTIAFHRVYNDLVIGQQYVELILIGDAVANLSGIFSINIGSPIYSNYNNKLYVSINSGISWSEVDTDFDISSFKIIDIEDVPGEFIGNTFDRVFFAAFILGNEYKLRVGTINDSRYVDGSRSAIEWTDISLPVTFENILGSGLKFVNSQYGNFLFVTSSNSIIKKQIDTNSANLLTGEWIEVRSESEITYPIVVSETNNDRMAFISNNRILVSKDSFTSESSSYKGEFLPGEDSSNYLVSKILLNPSGENEDEIFVSINNPREAFTASASILSLNVSENTNEITISNSGSFGSNPFIPENIWVKRPVIFRENGINFSFSSKIVESQGNKLVLLPTIIFNISGVEYSPLINETKITGTVSNTNENILIEDYNGNIFICYTDTEEIIRGRVSRISLEEDTVILSLNGDYAIEFTNRNIDFSLDVLLKIGSVEDILGFEGMVPESQFGNFVVSSSRPSSSNSNNGIYISNAFGVDWNQISVSESNGFVDGCVDFNVNDNGSINAVVTNGNSTRIFINDSWIPSENIKKVDVDSFGNLYFITDNGYCKTTLDLDSPNESVFKTNTFLDCKEFFIENKDIVVVDTDDNIYSNNKDSFVFNGSELFVPSNRNIKNINKIFKDSNDAYWIATESDGVNVFIGSNFYNFGVIEIGSLNVFDIFEDNFGRIWLALGADGISVISYVIENGSITNYTVERYSESSGFKGEVKAISQTNGLDYISSGENSPPGIFLTWANNSSVYPNSLLSRSKSEIRPVYEDRVYNINQTLGQIFSIQEDTISVDGENFLAWKIVAQNFSVTSGQSIGTNSLVNQYMLVNVRENDISRKVLANALDTVYVERVDGESEISSSGKNFLITEMVGEDHCILFSGDSNSINSSINDVSLICPDTYYYYLDFYDASGRRVEIDSKKISISLTDQFAQNASRIVVATTKGLWSFEGGPTPFIVKNQFNEAENITNIFVDTSNILYVSAGDILIQVTDNNRVDFGKNDLFSDNLLGVENKVLEVRNVIEGLSQEIIIATSIGLCIKRSDGTFLSFIEEDPRTIYREDKFNIGSWRPVYVLSGNPISSDFFVDKTSTSGMYSYSNIILNTVNNGRRWNEVVLLPYEIKGVLEIENSLGTIIDYVMFSENLISSTGEDSVLEDFDFISNRENIKVFDRTSSIGSPSHIYLSEASSVSENPIIFAGVFDNRITETEVEICKIKFNSQNDTNQDPTEIVGLPTNIGSAEGLSIQTIYRITKDSVSGDFYAGGKDNILILENGSSIWHPFEFSEENDSDIIEHCYTDLVVRNDSTALECSVVIYATRSALYGKITHDFVILRPQEVDLEKRITSIDVKQSFIENLSWVDRPGMNSYNWEATNHFTIGNHRGAICFLNAINVILVGGFDNKLFLMPFTSDRNDEIKNYHKKVSLISGRRNREATQLTITSQLDTWTQIFSGRKDLYDSKFMPRNSWGINFSEDSDETEVGIVSYLIFGQNSNYFETYYEHTPALNSSFLYRSYGCDMMFWEPFIVPNQPNGIFSDFKYYDGTLYSTSIYGSGKDNVGLFAIDLTTGWDKQDRSLTGNEQQYFNIPINEITVTENLIIPTLGFGIHQYDSLTFSGLESRFFTQYGIEYGRWNITCISQDPNNQNRVVVGTSNRGLMNGIYNSIDGGTTFRWEWSCDQFGFESGNITCAEILSVNSDIILVGVKDDGLYIKDSETKVYAKSTEGLPTTGDVVQIRINSFVSKTENSVQIENNGETILIIRSSYENPKENPTNAQEYSVGNEIFNSEVVYIGLDNFSESLYVDNDITLKSGIPYFYRIYDIGIGNIYTERDRMQGLTSELDGLNVYISGNVFSGKDLTGRILSVNTVIVRPLCFEISYNSYDSQTGLTTVGLVSDIYRIINQGNANIFDRFSVPYRVESTLIKKPRIVKPIWMVFKEQGSLYSKVYISNDNGIKWVEKTNGIPSNADILNIEISETEETRNFIKHVLYISTDIGIYYSTNDGTSWAKLSLDSNGLPDTGYKQVLVDTQDFRILYAITSTEDIYRSIDFGLSWNLILNCGSGLNKYSIVSEFSNSIFLGFDSLGIKKYYDPIREEFNVQVDSDSLITNVTFDNFEMGDEIFTDSNTIIAKTYPKNDNILSNFEKITFKTDDLTKYLTFKISRKEEKFGLDEIKIGQDEVNPLTIPFLLQNPEYDSGYIKVNKIGKLDSDENFAISNKGVHTTSNNGTTWQKLTSSFIPSNIKDLISLSDNSIILATDNGLWSSDVDRVNYRNVEQLDSEINVIWESVDKGVRRIFRGGENGLYITVERPISKTIITYSGDISIKKSIQFSWGSISNPNDGGWTDKTEEMLSKSVWAKSSMSSSLLEYKGWDSALIVRYGPFSTFEIAESYSNGVWLPENGSVYPNGFSSPESGFSFGKSAKFENSDSGLLFEESSNQKKYVGSQDSITYHTNGVIFIGDFPNVNSPNNYPQGKNYPTTDFPIIDRVDATIGEARRIEADGSFSITSTGYLENKADIRAYEDLITNGSSMTNKELLTALREDSDYKKQLAPILKSNMYYAYRVFPYRLIPDPTEIDGSGSFLTTPRYKRATGDLVDSFSFIVDIEKFSGSKRILCGVSTLSGNWIVGTNSGLFYSTENGQNVIKSQNLSSNLVGYKFVSMIYTSSNVVLAVAVSNSLNDIRFVRNSSDFTNESFDSNWEFLNNLSSLLDDVGANIVFNLEESNGKIYISTNKGVFLGNEDGTEWKFIGRVGNLESISGGKVLGQEFIIE